MFFELLLPFIVGFIVVSIVIGCLDSVKIECPWVMPTAVGVGYGGLVALSLFHTITWLLSSL